ncbi:MAG: TolC family protein [Sphingobacteriales bacterium]|nr:MAG: TolC family protein [Sphingobacteriales bacterium]
MKKIIVLVFIIFFYSLRTQAQPKTDTLTLKLPEAEAMFIQKNLLLLAQKYNIDAQKALIIQARLYPNPNIAIESGLYNTVSKKFFAQGADQEGGELASQLSQLVILAHKRNKQIKLVEANAQLSEDQFFDLLRTLKYSLRTSFFNIYFLKQSAQVYDKEIDALQVVVTAFEKQKEKAYISEREVVRVKAQLYSLQVEYLALINQINDAESVLRLILQVQPNVHIDPQVDGSLVKNLNPMQYPYAALLDSAYQNRTDLHIAKTNTRISRLNYNYQKSLAVPDVTLSLGYDKQGSYIHNFNSVGFSIDIPIFNRNQGNIKSAKFGIESNLAIQKSVEAMVEENIFRSLQKAIDADKMYKKIDPSFAADFDRLNNEVLLNYQRRNLSLLEFLDFYDSYKQNILQLNGIRFSKLSSLEDLNFYTGTNFFN